MNIDFQKSQLLFQAMRKTHLPNYNNFGWNHQSKRRKDDFSKIFENKFELRITCSILLITNFQHFINPLELFSSSIYQAEKDWIAGGKFQNIYFYFHKSLVFGNRVSGLLGTKYTGRNSIEKRFI